MRGPQYTRLRRPQLSLLKSVAIAVGVTVLSLTVLTLLGLDWGIVLGVAGIIFGLTIFLVTEMRNRESPRKSIVYVSQMDNIFNSNILEGFRDALGDALPHTLTVQMPAPSDLSRLTAWHTDVLRSHEAKGSAAIVTFPPRSDPQIWEEIADLMANGVFVVVLDVQPDPTFFANRGLQPPAFVASDFTAGGEAIGSFMAGELKKDVDALALVCIGPSYSLSGRIRSSRLMYELAREDLLRRVFIFELPSWQPENFIAELYARVTGLANQNKSLIVYCGNDRTMLALERRLDTPGQVLLGEVKLIGYDGVITNDGSLVVEDCPRAIATLDTRPRIQGRVAAELLREVYADGRNSHPFHLIEPVILTGPYWKT